MWLDTRTFVSLVVIAVVLAGCEPTTGVDATNTRADVLPATESTKDFGDFVLYFNALNTDQLSAEIADQYDIVRSKSRAMLNVSVHRKLASGETEPAPSVVTASAANLNGQVETMTLREIREDTAVYHVGELAITNGEVVIFTVEATPTGASPLTVRFQKQFFIDQ